jgi:hypothetical protein
VDRKHESLKDHWFGMLNERGRESLVVYHRRHSDQLDLSTGLPTVVLYHVGRGAPAQFVAHVVRTRIRPARRDEVQDPEAVISRCSWHVPDRTHTPRSLSSWDDEPEPRPIYGDPDEEFRCEVAEEINSNFEAYWTSRDSGWPE